MLPHPKPHPFIGEGGSSKRIPLPRSACELIMICCTSVPFIVTVYIYFSGAGTGMCPLLTTPENGRIMYAPTGCPGSDSAPGNCNATYSCNRDFHLNDTSIRMCTASGSWSGYERTCGPGTQNRYAHKIMHVYILLLFFCSRT